MRLLHTGVNIMNAAFTIIVCATNGHPLIFLYIFRDEEWILRHISKNRSSQPSNLTMSCESLVRIRMVFPIRFPWVSSVPTDYGPTLVACHFLLIQVLVFVVALDCIYMQPNFCPDVLVETFNFGCFCIRGSCHSLFNKRQVVRLEDNDKH
jgi:hypothetical protein